ncbi:hypothetical protein E3N88_37594 [Mikania micrantha]|uniref:Uncharacterized protein n=1 Tax=Mikania micrantha TaxID=192012 RepID=A0A5N6LRJ3_9ASTR|nr:hypothetical protein E3N88_37594 [Mikania micrantha]
MESEEKSFEKIEDGTAAYSATGGYSCQKGRPYSTAGDYSKSDQKIVAVSYSIAGGSSSYENQTWLSLNVSLPQPLLVSGKLTLIPLVLPSCHLVMRLGLFWVWSFGYVAILPDVISPPDRSVNTWVEWSVLPGI